jgi:sulfate adenylyltransferase subunit 2
LTGATLSSAATVPAVIREMLATKTSEREGRGVDKDGATSLEKRKHEGYF